MAELAISDFTIIEITLAVLAVILIPVFRHFYKADISNKEQLTNILNRLESLEKSEIESKQDHKEIRKDITGMKQDITEIKTLLSLRNRDK